MVKDVIGYRFSPTEEEVINYYLKNKILGKTWLTDEAISEINILSYIPELLPRYAKIRSGDLNWFFFNRIEYMSPNSKAMKRATVSGYWKPTGKAQKIRDKKGNGDEIGFKKTLVYHEGKVPNGVWTPWAMHEYHITSLPQDQRTFVVCKVIYKGDGRDISYGNNSSETGQSEVEQPEQENCGISLNDLRTSLNEQEDLSEWDEYFNPNMLLSGNNNINNNPDVLQQSPYLTQEDNQFLSKLPPAYQETVQHLFSDQENDYQTTGAVGNNNTVSQFEQPSQDIVYGLSEDDLRVPMTRNHDLFPLYAFEPNSLLSDYKHSNVSCDQEFIVQENHNKHRPKKPLTGFIDCSSESDIDEAESISASSYKGSSSPTDSVASSSRCFLSTEFRKDLQTNADSSARNAPKYQLIHRTVPSELEVKQDTSRAVNASMEEKSTKKKGLGFITEEESIERNQKSPQYVYLMNTIVAFIVLMVLIRNIISAILTVKA